MDCDLWVISLWPPHSLSRRCAGCEFLANLLDPAEREVLRLDFAARGVIGRPRVCAGRA